LHVRKADEAYPIGPAPARESYLCAERIIDVARHCGAQAIHPGYGFLAENAEFADQCLREGITFIGPPSAAMRVLGEKIPARQMARDVAVPTIPGSQGAVADLATTRSLASQIGYPGMHKASAGEGGKTLRLTQSEAEKRESWKV